MIVLTEDKKEDYIHYISTVIHTKGLTLDELYNIVFFGYRVDKNGDTFVSKFEVSIVVIKLLCILTNIDYIDSPFGYTFNVVDYEKNKLK